MNWFAGNFSAQETAFHFQREGRFFRFENQIEPEIASDNESNLYIPFSDGQLISFDLNNNQKRWQIEFGGKIASAPLTAEEDGNVYVVGTVGKKAIIRSLFRSTGLTDWETALVRAEQTEQAANFEQFFLHISGNDLIVIGSKGNVSIFSKKNGQHLLSKNLKAELSAKPLFYDGKIALGTFDNRIITLLQSSLQLEQTVRVAAPPTVLTRNSEDSQITVGDTKGVISFINSKTGLVTRKFRAGAKISGIRYLSREILVSSLDNFVYLLTSEADKIIWKRRLDGRISEPPQIFQSRLMMTSTESRTISVVEINSGKLSDKIFLQEGAFLTGHSLKTESFLVYMISNGILSFRKPLNKL